MKNKTIGEHEEQTRKIKELNLRVNISKRKKTGNVMREIASKSRRYIEITSRKQVNKARVKEAEGI